MYIVNRTPYRLIKRIFILCLVANKDIYIEGLEAEPVLCMPITCIPTLYIYTIMQIIVNINILRE